MIINNGAYLNYMNVIKPSNDLNAAKDNPDSTNKADSNGAVDNKPDTANKTENKPQNNLPANMDSLDINPNTKDIKDTKDVKDTKDIKNADNTKDIKDTPVANVEEVETEAVSKPKFDWKYNTTKDGYLPEFQLGQWEKTSGILFGENVMKIEERSFSVFLPKELQDKMAGDEELAKKINAKLEEFFNANIKENDMIEEGVDLHVVSQQIAVSMDKDGNILHSYVRTESYSTTSGMPPVANDENALNTLELNPEEKETKDLNIKYGFAAYQTTIQVGTGSKEITEEEKHNNAMAAIGVDSVVTSETAHVEGSEPVTKIRKANGDVVELETGRLIQKHAGYADNLQKYDAKV